MNKIYWFSRKKVRKSNLHLQFVIIVFVGSVWLTLDHEIPGERCPLLDVLAAVLACFNFAPPQFFLFFKRI